MVTEVVLKIPATVTTPVKVVTPPLLESVNVPLVATEVAPCTFRFPVPPKVKVAKPLTLKVVVMVRLELKAPVVAVERKPPIVRFTIEKAGETSMVTVVPKPPVVTVFGELNCPGYP